MSRIAAAAIAIIIASPSPVLAQDDDWDLTRDPEKKLVSATVMLSSGLVLAARCLDGRFDAVMGGLPEAPEGASTRTLQLTVRDGDAYPSTWNVTTNPRVAVSDYPAATARSWRTGGRFQVGIPGGAPDGRTLRHDVTLPASSAAIGEALTACGKPLEDARDALLPDVPSSGLSAPAIWSRAPRPEFPSQERYSGGYAVVTCLNQPNGFLGNCVVESEHPHDANFGRAAVRAARRAQVEIPGETRGNYTPRLIGFRTVFRTE